MKTIKLTLVVLVVLTAFVSCSEDDGVSPELQCALDFQKRLDDAEDEYLEDLMKPDSNGNMSSTEKCIQDRNYTRQYVYTLEGFKLQLSALHECDPSQVEEFRERIENDIENYEEGLATFYDEC